MILAPRIEGRLSIRSGSAVFRQAFRRRVESGLLTGQPQPRSNYVVSEAADGRLKIRAADLSTAIAVGLNELELHIAGSDVVEYQVRYWRWAGYAILLSAILGTIGLVLLLAFDARGYIASHQSAQLPGLSIDQNLRMAWAMVLFWGFAWPWILVALHKRTLRRLIARIVAEVDASVGGG